MKGYVQAKNNVACAKSLAGISPKSALKVARVVNGMKVKNAKSFLNSLIEGKISIENKFYTASAEGLLDVISSAELNAEKKDIDMENLKLNISVHKGPKRMRSRRKRNFGLQLKLANIQVILSSNKSVKVGSKIDNKEEVKKTNVEVKDKIEVKENINKNPESKTDNKKEPEAEKIK